MLSNCAPITLLQYLKEHVTALADESSKNLKFYVLSDEYANEADENVKSFMDYTPKRFKDEFLARKHLILIYQGAQIVIGMSVFEYAYTPSNPDSQLNWSRAYVQYVDTTGLFTPRPNQSHLTRSLVKSYFSYCKDVLNMGSVHLLATAKPAFLFAGSEFIEGKRALPAVKLINWWIRLIQDFSAKEKCQVFVYSPAEEAEGSTRMKKRISGFEGWTYGLPYASSLSCVEQVPLFEDDPKWRHFEATILDDDELHEELERKTKKRPRIIDDDHKIQESQESKVPKCRVSVKEFFESIQIRPEFRSDPSTFFVLQFPKRIRDTANFEPIQHGKSSDLASFGIKMLSGLTFESESAAKASSQKIAGWLKLMAVPGVEIKQVTKSIEKDEKENIPSVQVKSLQSFIKKKPLKQ